jgi:soluble lytic murein transglycosylase
MMGAYYLQFLAERVEGTIFRLAGYNAGLGRARRWRDQFGDLPPILQLEAIPFYETRWYVRRIAVSYAYYAARLGLDADVDALERFLQGEVWE